MATAASVAVSTNANNVTNGTSPAKRIVSVFPSHWTRSQGNLRRRGMDGGAFASVLGLDRACMFIFGLVADEERGLTGVGGAVIRSVG